MAMAPLPAHASSSTTTSPLLPSSPSISSFLASHPALTLLHTQCATMAHLRQLQAALVKSGLAKDPIAASRAVAFCAGEGHDAAYAARLVRHHPKPNSFMWYTAIRALPDGPSPDAAVALFLDMLRSPTPPERRTFLSLFAAYVRLGRADDGAALHGMVLKLGLAASPGDSHDRGPLEGWARRRGVGGVRRHAGPDRGDVERHGERILLRHQVPGRRGSLLRDAGGRRGANANVLVSVLGCCGSLGALEQGAWVHAYIDKHGVAMNALVVTALVDMYCKCGSIHKARQVFDTSRSQGFAVLSTWNAMMLGLAVHGQYQEALSLFSQLKTYGLRPDNVTFIAILMAHGHSGMVDEAKALFASMATEYGVTPGIEHYGCLFDALARAGRLREAEELIWAMPMKPDAAIRSALLSGCRLHGDAQAGVRAAREAVKCDPRDSGAYVLARDDEVGRGLGVRGKMREEGVAKVPGCSMIEVNGVVHEFVG
ncbi:unnamed protein product [Alopecurus aequalis]